MSQAAEVDSFFIPDWPASANVRACISLRQGGASCSPYLSNNLAMHVDDDPVAVAANRQQLIEQAKIPGQPQWLEQIHGIKVVQAQDDGLVRTADACYSKAVGQACAVLTADCLPLLICDKAGSQVAAVHAGWRGLADGIVREALAALDVPPRELLIYLGPAIGSQEFEVGIDVLEAFFEGALSTGHAEAISACFTPSLKQPLKFYADLYALARAELQALGVDGGDIYGGDVCTYRDTERFFSYRRDGVTGRMASIIWRV